MSARQTIPVVVIVVVAIVGVVTPAVAAPVTDGSAGDLTRTAPQRVFSDDSNVNDTTNGTTNTTAPMGSQISAFMQSTTAQAHDSVETGMWVARFNATNQTARPSMVDHRTAVLQTRLDRLRAELADLNTSGSSMFANVRYAGRVASLTARIDALESTLNRTSTVAASHGVDRSKLHRLERNASSLNGQAVAHLARGLTVVETPGRGPPTNGTHGRGPPGGNNSTGRSGNSTHGPSGNGSGNQRPSGNASNGSGNQGPSGNASNGSGTKDDSPGSTGNASNGTRTQGPSGSGTNSTERSGNGTNGTANGTSGADDHTASVPTRLRLATRVF
ncbi:MAG: hypothetical protein ABEI57_02675 [Halapricum sp.]